MAKIIRIPTDEEINESISQHDIMVESENERTKESFITPLENFKNHIKGEETIDTFSENLLKVIFMIALRRGYHAIEENELQVFLKKNLMTDELDPGDAAYNLEILMNMADCIVDGINTAVAKEFSLEITNNKVQERSSLILYRFIRYFRLAKGEKNSKYQKIAIGVVDSIISFAEKKFFLASHND